MKEIKKKLLDEAYRGDRRAQLHLYETCFPFLMGVTLRYKIFPDASAELINDAFIKIVSNLNKFKDGSSFPAWIKRIMINTIIDDIRKNKNWNKLTSLEAEMDTVVKDRTYNNFIHDEAQREILSWLDVLPPATRCVFNLFAIEGYSHKEIAKMLSIGEETSKWHVKQARRALKKNKVF